MNLGADDYLTKPFEEIDLINAVETRLSRTKAIKQTFSPTTEGFNSLIANAKLSDLIETKKIKKINKKETVFREGDSINAVYLLESGKIKLSKINEDGKELITELLTSGDYFGYVSVFNEKFHSETATVMEDSEICIIPKSEFMTLVESNSQVAAMFFKLLSKNLEIKEQELIDLAYNTVRKRVADSLLKLKDTYKTDNSGKFSIAISRGDIASIVGTAKESAIRFLSEFKDEGIIDIKGSTITILDEKALKNSAY
jgi:CRP-like cAMP-binding protein